MLKLIVYIVKMFDENGLIFYISEEDVVWVDLVDV